MYRIVANHFELPPPGSEQFLAIVVGCAPEFQTVATFLAACEEATRADVSGIEPKSFAQVALQELTDHLDRFIPLVTVPRTAQVYIFHDGWENTELLIHWPGRYIWYYRYSTA